MRKVRAFTLLEVLLVIALLTLASGAIGWRLHQMIAKKRFTSSTEKLRSRLNTCRRLALNMQADWKGLLTQQGDHWMLEISCPDSSKITPLPPLLLGDLSLFLDGDEKQGLVFHFTATGEVYPKGNVKLSQKRGKEEVSWKLPDIFLQEEGGKLGPVHPAEVRQ